MKKISDIQQSLLSHFFQKLTDAEKIQIKISDYLPQNLCRHCRVIKINQGVLTMAVSNSLWLTKLRYLTPMLLEALKQHTELPIITEINSYIEPKFTELFRLS